MSERQLFSFESFHKEELEKRYTSRKGELKLGDKVVPLRNAKYVILGIEECVGPIANKGRGGAQYGFESFLNKFLNMQSNETLAGDDICILGKVISKFEANSPDNYSRVVEELDDFVFKVLTNTITNNQIPIVIGGGHNNSYPILKFIHTLHQSKINVLNLDAHADYRPLEGRHSGNPFSFAFKEGYIKNYTVHGLHQRYNSQRIIDDLRKDNHNFSFYEDYIDGKSDLKSIIESYVEENTHNKIGVELDLDVIERMPTSAFSPSGVSLELARYYIRKVAQLKEVVYLHLPEGAPLNEQEELIVGKTLAYLVTDFISSHGDSKL